MIDFDSTGNSLPRGYRLDCFIMEQGVRLAED